MPKGNKDKFAFNKFFAWLVAVLFLATASMSNKRKKYDLSYRCSGIYLATKKMN